MRIFFLYFRKVIKLLNEILMGLQKIKDIFQNGVDLFEKTFKRLTNYHDLKGKRSSTKKRHRQTLNNMLNDEQTKISDLVNFCETIGLEVGEIPIFKSGIDDSKKNLTFKIHESTQEEVATEKNVTLSAIVEFKDENLVSDKTYDKWQKTLAPEHPTLFRVRKERYARNQAYFKIYRNDYGNYVDCDKKICHYIKKNFDKLKIKDNTIRVKLCGDGTNIGRKLKKLNFCFTLPDSGLFAQTAAGNYTLGIFKMQKENHVTLEKVLSEISENLTKFAEKCQIEIQGRIYDSKFSLGGDMKFLHDMMGLNACNSNYSCLICKLLKDDFYKNNLETIKKLKRTIQDQKNKLGKGFFLSDSGNADGYKNSPIFSFITFDDLIFDTLHLSLRLPGKLINLILSELISLDNSNSSNLEDLPHQKSFYSSLSKLGIDKPYNLEKNQNQNGMHIKVRTFNGDESLLIMEKLDFEVAFPQKDFPRFTKGKKFTELFKKFHNVFMKLKSNFYINNEEQCEKDTAEWLELFLSIFHTNQVTPYIHLFVAHLADFISSFGDVDIFNIQGLEKLNDFTSQQYFRATNKHFFSTYQMISYRNRVESSRLNDIIPIRKPIQKRTKKKDIKSSIIEIESKKNWCQFIVNDYILQNSEINRFGMNSSSSLVNLFHLELDYILKKKIYFL